VRCVLVYDISDDNLRSKVADICMDYGLDRIQYSAFAGQIGRTFVEVLGLKLKRGIGKKKDAKVQIFSICERDWEERISIP